MAPGSTAENQRETAHRHEQPVMSDVWWQAKELEGGTDVLLWTGEQAEPPEVARDFGLRYPPQIV